MKTVLYLDFVRNRRHYLGFFVKTMAIFLLIFIVSVVVDTVVPGFNYRYMRWPDIVKNLLAMPSWNHCLYANLWQIAAMVYPFFLIYEMMSGLTDAVLEEDRLETAVYMRGLSVGRGAVVCGKFLLRVIVLLVSCALLFLENMLFFLFLDLDRMIAIAGKYAVLLAGVSIFYMMAALFLASFHEEEGRCRSMIQVLLVLTFLLARLHVVVDFLAELLVMTGRTGIWIDTLNKVSSVLGGLDVLAPLVWCWPNVPLQQAYAAGGVLIALICGVTGYSIYVHKKESELV